MREKEEARTKYIQALRDADELSAGESSAASWTAIVFDDGWAAGYAALEAELAEKEERIAELLEEVEDAKDSAGKAITAMTCKQCGESDQVRNIQEGLCRTCQLERLREALKLCDDVLVVLCMADPGAMITRKMKGGFIAVKDKVREALKYR